MLFEGINMKTLTLLASRLMQFSLKNKIVFFLFILGGVLNSIMFAYLYGNLRPIVSNYNSTDYNYRKYTVFCNGNVIDEGFEPLNPDKNYVSEDDINALIDTGLFETIIVDSLYCQSNTDDSIPLESICACIYGNTDCLTVENGTNIFVSNNQTVMSNVSGSSVGGTIMLRGEEFEIIGRSSDLNISCLVTAEKYRELDPYTNHLILISKSRWHLSNDAPSKALRALFPKYYISGLYAEETDLAYSNQVLPPILINFAVTMIAFVFLLDYLTSLISNENTISIIVGARPITVAVMAVLEGTVLSIITIISGLLLHYLLYNVLFSQFIMGLTLNYSLQHYLEMLLLMTVVSIMIMIIRSLKYLKMAPLRLRSREI